MKPNKSQTKTLTTDALLTTLLILTGMIKLPSFVPGAEFQLSAPLAILIVTLLGFKRYLGIGICSSCIQLMLGTHTILNVTIAMIFRIVAGTIVTLAPHKKTAMRVMEYLREHGYYVSAIRYPTVAKHSARLRLALMSSHTTEEIDGLVELLKRFEWM